MTVYRDFVLRQLRSAWVESQYNYDKLFSILRDLIQLLSINFHFMMNWCSLIPSNAFTSILHSFRAAIIYTLQLHVIKPPTKFRKRVTWNQYLDLGLQPQALAPQASAHVQICSVDVLLVIHLLRRPLWCQCALRGAPCDTCWVIRHLLGFVHRATCALHGDIQEDVHGERGDGCMNIEEVPSETIATCLPFDLLNVLIANKSSTTLRRYLDLKSQRIFWEFFR
jgi:hypothetical protein